MKIVFVSFLILLAINSSAQSKPKSLKDLLYSGKMKVDSTAVTRKGDDLSTKIDTTTKKAAVPATPKAVPAGNAGTASPVDSVTGSDLTAPATNVKAPVTPLKNNTKVWKEYTDSLLGTLKTELLNSKKIKKDTYFLTVDYEINVDGSLSILNVASSPQNAFLQEEVKNRITLTAPQLSPFLDSNKQPRKVKRKHNFSVSKD